MKKVLFIAMMFICAFANAQEWIDLTSYFFNNPNFKDGSLDNWEYYANPNGRADGAVLYKGSNPTYVYNYATGYPKGHYRLTVYGFYRDGSAASDWNKSINSSYKGNSKAVYYIYYNGNAQTCLIPCASSCALDEPLDSTDTKVGTGKYIPSTVESAAKWFKAGHYAKSFEFNVTDDNYCYVEPVVQTNDANGIFVFGGVKLEYKGDLKLHEKIEISRDTVYLSTGIRDYIGFTPVPNDVTLLKYQYISSDPNIATVSQYGQITGVSEGEATITMMAIDGSGVSATVKVFVKNPDMATMDNVKLSEVLVINNNWRIDASCNYGSLIELYNPSLNYVTLDGLYLTDDKDNLKKGAINLKNEYSGNTNLISPRGFRSVGFDHYDAVFAPDMIDFKLKLDGGTLYLTNGTEIMDSVAYPKAITNVSYAKDLETGNWSLCTHPSLEYYVDPTEFPNLYGTEQVPAPSFSEGGGFFTGKKTVTLHVPEGAIVSLTTDGTLPTRNHGDKFVEDTEIEFTTSKPFRAMAYKSGYLNSDIVTQTFIKKEKRFVFPSINIVTDPENLNDYYYGIFVSGGNYGRPGNGKSYSCNWNADWDRPASFEFLNANGDYVFSQDVDISACGGWSRAWTPHSFKIKTNKFYSGQSSMNYPFFDTKPNIRHKVLQIRNGGNDNICRFIDPAIQECVRRSGLQANTQSWQPVHVFINGEYQTVLNMREPNNKHYAYSNYGYDTDEVDQFEISCDSGYVQKTGTPDKFNEWYDLSANSADSVTFDSISKLVDIDEFINYMAVELFLANKDWPQNNVKGFRSVNDGKFHFVLFDLDQSNELTESPFKAFERKKNYEFNTLYGDSRTPWKTGDHIKAEIKLVTIFLNMLKNDSFRRQFIDTYCIVAGSVFNSGKVLTVLDNMRSYMNSGMNLSGENCDNSYSTVKNGFTQSLASTKTSYLKMYAPMKLTSTLAVTTNLSANIDEAKIFVNGVRVPYNYLSGKLYGDFTLSTTAPEGYIFLGWSKLAKGKIEVTEPSFKIEGASSVRYVANWRKMTDEEMIAYGITSKPVVINEVSATNDIYVSDYYKKADWFELYNTTDNDINIAGMYMTDNVEKPYKYQVPTDDEKLNTIIPAHGYKVIWCDKKENIGSAIHANFKLEGEEGTVMISKTEDDNVLYSDTLAYVQHDGTESYGRYPDAGFTLYKMSKMTPGASNICQSDFIGYINTDKIITGIESVVNMKSESGIVISYVGNGVINIKSENALNNITVVSTSGNVVYEDELKSTFETVSLPSLTNGMYIVRVTDKNNNSASSKIVLK